MRRTAWLSCGGTWETTRFVFTFQLLMRELAACYPLSTISGGAGKRTTDVSREGFGCRYAFKEATMRPLYLDYNATAPTDARVFEAMRPYFMEDVGNAGS